MLRQAFHLGGQLSLYLALGATSIAAATAHLAGANLTFATLALPFLCTFCVYNFDRLRDSRHAEAKACPEMSRVFLVWQRLIQMTVAIALGLMVYLGARAGWRVLAVCLMFPLSGVLYVVPCLPTRGIRRLKDIPAFKTFYVAACWCLLVVLVAELHAIPLLTPSMLVMMVFVYLQVFLGAYIGDLRDEGVDAEAGVRTLAQLLGFRRSFLLIILMEVAGMLLVVMAHLRHLLPEASLGLIGTCLLSLGFWAVARASKGASEQLCEGYDLVFVAFFPCILAVESLVRG